MKTIIWIDSSEVRRKFIEELLRNENDLEVFTRESISDLSEEEVSNINANFIILENCFYDQGLSKFKNSTCIELGSSLLNLPLRPLELANSLRLLK